MNWIIYTLKNPRTNEVRYVGWTKRGGNRRLNTHIQEAVGKIATTHKARWILSLLSVGIRPVMDVIESGTGEGWREAEQRWIALFRAQGVRLTNATDGGEGTVGYKPSAKARELTSLRTKGKPMNPDHLAKWHAGALAANLGRSLSQEHRDKLAKLQKGKKRPQEATAPMLAANFARLRAGVSPETRAKISAVHTGMKASEETRAKMSAAHAGKPWSEAHREARAKKGGR